MKINLKNLSQALMDVHKRFLENEKNQAERYFEKKISSFEFVMMLTQNKGFAWLQPFSALIAEIDALADSEEEMSEAEMKTIAERVEFLLKDPASSVVSRYNHHLRHDPAFIMFHSNLKNELNVFLKESVQSTS